MSCLGVALITILAGCGRLHFDPLGGGRGDGDGGGSGTTVDAAFAGRTITYLKASNTDTLDLFGRRLAISPDGGTLAIGAQNEDSAAVGIDGDQTSNMRMNSGAVYVFVRDGTSWIQQAYVKASNTGASDQFGVWEALSFDGNTLAIGAYQESGLALYSGAAYVFERTGSTWTERAYLKAPNPDTSDVFGIRHALSADGTTLAVGSLEDSAAIGIDGNQLDNSAVDSGAVYVYTRTGSTWLLQAYVKASNTGAGDGFGFAIALSTEGNTLAISAAGEDSAAIGIDGDGSNDAAVDSGAVYVFSRTGSTWAQQAYIKASNTSAGDRFGTSVALSADGNRLAIGAFAEDSSATGVDGEQANDAAMNSGAVYIFARAGSTWTQQSYVKATQVDVDDGFGDSVWLSGDGKTLAVGIGGEDSASASTPEDNSLVDSGAAAIFVLDGTQWSQRAFLKAPVPGSGDQFALVALSADATTLLVGAGAEDSAARGIDGDQTNDSAMESGAAYVFQ